jgi:sugar (pentulose or hexulose) kinase
VSVLPPEGGVRTAIAQSGRLSDDVVGVAGAGDGNPGVAAVGADLGGDTWIPVAGTSDTNYVVGQST